MTMTLDEAKAQMDRLHAERRDVSDRIDTAMTDLRDAWCAHHGVKVGGDIMLKRWSSNYSQPAEPRRAIISMISVSSYGNISMTAKPYTKDGKRGSRRTDPLSDDQWEKIG